MKIKHTTTRELKLSRPKGRVCSKADSVAPFLKGEQYGKASSR